LRGESEGESTIRGAASLFIAPLKRRKHKDKNQKKKQKLGFPIEDFGNDRKRGRHPGDF